MNRYEMEPILSPAGRFVIYGDHLNAIEKLEARLAELEGVSNVQRGLFNAAMDRAEASEAREVEQGAILSAIMGALKGEEPSDFMRSFPDVEHAWWVYRLAYPTQGMGDS